MLLQSSLDRLGKIVQEIDFGQDADGSILFGNQGYLPLHDCRERHIQRGIRRKDSLHRGDDLRDLLARRMDVTALQHVFEQVNFCYQARQRFVRI